MLSFDQENIEEANIICCLTQLAKSVFNAKEIEYVVSCCGKTTTFPYTYKVKVFDKFESVVEANGCSLFEAQYNLFLNLKAMGTNIVASINTSIDMAQQIIGELAMERGEELPEITTETT